jgi:YidC/Oxa1 family membrane protein insertase
MIALYNTLFYQPLLNALVFLYNTAALGDLGLAIIELTILIRIVLFPIFQKSARHQAVMQRLQPKLKEIQEKHKDYNARNQASLDLFREHQINPFSGILLFLLQLPILFALYHIFLNVFSPEFLSVLYPAVAAPPSLKPEAFFGLLNLEKSNIVMVGLAAVTQYFQGKLALPPKSGGQPSASEAMVQRMVWIGPILTGVILWNLPSAAALYWTVSSLFSIAQQGMINRQLNNGQLGKTN